MNDTRIRHGARAFPGLDPLRVIPGSLTVGASASRLRFSGGCAAPGRGETAGRTATARRCVVVRAVAGSGDRLRSARSDSSWGRVSLHVGELTLARGLVEHALLGPRRLPLMPVSARSSRAAGALMGRDPAI